MQTNTKIRPVMLSDLPTLKATIEANSLFPLDLLDDIISDYFAKENGSSFCFTYEDKEPVATAYCAPEQMTEGTWNLLFIF